MAGNPRYFLIGCYTLPVSQGVALTEAIGKLGGQVKMTPLDEGEEKDDIIPGEYYDYHLEENERALAELDQVDAYLAGREQQMELQHEEEEERNIFSETELDPPRLASENVPNQEDVQSPEDHMKLIQENWTGSLSKEEKNQRKHCQRFWSENWIFKMLGGRTRSQS